MLTFSTFYQTLLSAVYPNRNGVFAQRRSKAQHQSTLRARSDNFQLNILALNWRCLKHPLAGGAETNIFEQSTHWVKQGHNVTVFTSQPGEGFDAEPNEDFHGVHIIRRGGRLTVYLYAALFLLFASHRYDVILDISNGIPFFAPLFTRTRTVLMVHHVHHEQWFYEFPGLAGRFGWFLELRVVPFIYRRNRVITVSPTTEEEMIKVGYKRKNLYLVFSGLNINVTAQRHESPTPTIAYVGRLKGYKRVHLLIEAIDKLRDKFPDIRLEIAGTGDNYGDLAEEIKSRKLEDHVTMHGYVSDEERAHILSTATVFATPSMQEGWGLSVIEANAYGCPAVAYDVPGLQVSIPNNETGLLAKDDDDFVRCLARIIQDDQLRARLSKGALYWANLFDWESSAISTLSILTMD